MRDVKGHQYQHIGQLDTWSKINVECDLQEKEKWNRYQIYRNSTKRLHTIQYKMWRLYSDVPLDLEGKYNLNLATKVSTKILEIIDNTTFKPPLLDYWNRMYTLNKKFKTRGRLDFY